MSKKSARGGEQKRSSKHFQRNSRQHQFAKASEKKEKSNGHPSQGSKMLCLLEIEIGPSSLIQDHVLHTSTRM